jgi:WD40 repeat protein
VFFVDGQLASGSRDKSVRLWNVCTGAETRRLLGYGQEVLSLGQLPNGMLAAGTSDGWVQLWDVATGDLTCSLNAGGPVHSLCGLPDGRLAAGSEDRTIIIWETRTGFSTEPDRIEGHTERVNALCLTSDGRLASSSDDRTIRVWDVAAAATPNRRDRTNEPISALLHLPGGPIVSHSLDHVVRLWDNESGAEIACLEDNLGRAYGRRSPRDFLEPWCGGGICLVSAERFAVSSRLGFQLWDVIPGGKRARFTAQIHTDNYLGGDLCLLSDGRLAAAGYYDRSITLWDLASRRQTGSLRGHGSVVSAMCALSEGRLASGSWDGTVRVWEPTFGTEISRLGELVNDLEYGLPGPARVSALCQLSDRRLASFTGDGTIHVWNLATCVPRPFASRVSWTPDLGPLAKV